MSADMSVDEPTLSDATDDETVAESKDEIEEESKEDEVNDEEDFDEPVDAPSAVEQKAAEAVDVLGFEALYQTDIEEGADDRMCDSSEASSVFGLDALFGSSGNPQDEGSLAFSSEDSRSKNKDTSMEASQDGKSNALSASGASKGSVAWFHQQRVDKYKERARKVDIIMVTDDMVAKRVSPKRQTSVSTADTSISSITGVGVHESKLTRRSKRRLRRKKMRGWLHGHRGSSANSKVQANVRKVTVEKPRPPPPPSNPADPPMEEINVGGCAMDGRTKRLTIVSEGVILVYCICVCEPFLIDKLRRPQVLKKKRMQAKERVDSACSLFVEEIFDMGYFCQCLGESFKEEGLRCTGYGNTGGDENSVVAEEDNGVVQEEEKPAEDSKPAEETNPTPEKTNLPMPKKTKPTPRKTKPTPKKTLISV
jgi:hypothetical protein